MKVETTSCVDARHSADMSLKKGRARAGGVFLGGGEALFEVFARLRGGGLALGDGHVELRSGRLDIVLRPRGEAAWPALHSGRERAQHVRASTLHG